MRSLNLIFISVIGLILAGCSPTNNNLVNQPTSVVLATENAPQILITKTPQHQVSSLPTFTPTFLPTKSENTPFAQSQTPISPPIVENTATPLPVEIISESALVIDHRSIAEFTLIPDEYIQAASELTLLHRHASVGANILQGLTCMKNDYEDRPFACDRNIPPEEIVFDQKYDFTNWTFEFHSPPPNPNPGWWNKVGYFIERLDSQPEDDPFAYAGFNLCYVDAIVGSNVADVFFTPNSSDNLPDISDLESAELRHPQTRFIYWTLCLAKIVGTEEATRFNQQQREYAISNGKVLMDLADIESHNPDGEPCINESGYPVICPEYNDETRGGHLNARGQLRLAKAMWVLVARLAGWDGGETLAP